MIQELNLTKIEAIHARMEDYSKKHIEEFDLVTARAVANISILTEISAQALKLGGKLVLLKANLNDELDNSLEHIQKLSFNLIKIESFLLVIEKSQRNIVVLEKQEQTNKKYPRTVDQIKRELNL